jgi:predicted transcriptional regulator
MNFSCIHFEETRKGPNFGLQDFLSHLENLSQKDRIEMKARIREGEAALAKAKELLKAETERRKRGEQVLKEIGERLGYLSSQFSGCQEKN